jgi:hypothetical protein
MAKAAFNKKKTLFTSTLDLNLRNNLVKCYIWTIALYGAEQRNILHEIGKWKANWITGLFRS